MGVLAGTPGLSTFKLHFVNYEPKHFADTHPYTSYLGTREGMNGSFPEAM